MSLAPVQHSAIHFSVRINGGPISDYSGHLVQQMAVEARIHTVYVTSVRRTVQDQARIFYNKHIVERKPAKYKNPKVAAIVAHARELKHKGQSAEKITKYLIAAIEHVHGGPGSISRHIGFHPFCEVFDIAHYSGPTNGASRHNYMSPTQARAFLEACRKRIGNQIARVGHSAELGLKWPPNEFVDEKCFHLEVRQPIFDKLEHAEMIA